MPRPESGPMRFGDDWTGVFVRGRDAMAFGFQLRLLLNEQVAADDFQTRVALETLERHFVACIHQGEAAPEAQLMLPFEEAEK